MIIIIRYVLKSGTILENKFRGLRIEKAFKIGRIQSLILFFVQPYIGKGVTKNIILFLQIKVLGKEDVDGDFESSSEKIFRFKWYYR